MLFAASGNLEYEVESRISTHMRDVSGIREGKTVKLTACFEAKGSFCHASAAS